MSNVASRTVELAIAAAGNRDNQWLKRVYDNVAEIAVMLQDESEIKEWARRIDEAARYRTIFHGWEDEIPQGWTRPSRLLINCQSDSAIKNAPGKPGHNPEGLEHFRTDPLWTRPGKLMAARIKDVRPGSELLVYKFTEDVDGERKSRVLVHFEVLKSPRADVRPPAQAQTSEQPTQAAPSAEPPVAVPPEAHSHDDNRQLTEIERRFMALSGPNKVAYGRACKEVGITNPIVPDPEQMQVALDMLAGLEE